MGPFVSDQVPSKQSLQLGALSLELVVLLDPGASLANCLQCLQLQVPEFARARASPNEAAAAAAVASTTPLFQLPNKTVECGKLRGVGFAKMKRLGNLASTLRSTRSGRHGSLVK